MTLLFGVRDTIHHKPAGLDFNEHSTFHYRLLSSCRKHTELIIRGVILFLRPHCFMVKLRSSQEK